MLATVVCGCGPDETISGYSDPNITWQLVELNGQPYPVRAVIRFPAEGEVQGEGPCNGFSAKQRAPLPWIEITEIALTRRSCPDVELEPPFLEALRQATLAEPGPDVLLLTNEEGLEMLFRPAEPSDDPA